MPAYTIAQVEQAINYWRDRQVSTDDAVLGPRASSLAHAYGVMIVQHVDSVDESHLNDEQTEALMIALYQQELPL